MTSIIAKRRSLHNQLKEHQQQKETLEKQAIQLESLANLGCATAMIAHELNNLLTPLANYAELSLQNPEDRVLTERALRKTAQNCRHAGKVMEGILSIANAGFVSKVETSLLPLVKGVFDCLCRDFSKDNITVEIRVNDKIRINAVPVQIQQAIMNLVLNAREAMVPKGGKLSIEATEDLDHVRIKISDTGAGIEPSQLNKVFESFFTTKTKDGQNRSGTGLGLALCKKVVEHHNGTITVESLLGQGTSFSILLPKTIIKDKT